MSKKVFTTNGETTSDLKVAELEAIIEEYILFSGASHVDRKTRRHFLKIIGLYNPHLFWKDFILINHEIYF